MKLHHLVRKPGGFLRFLLLVAPALLALCSAMPAEARQWLQGQIPAAVTNLALRPFAHLDPTNQLTVAIALPLRDRPGLARLLSELYDPASPRFRQFVSTDEFAESFGPSAADYQAVLDFAGAHGLSVAATYSNRMIVDVRASVLEIEAAFHVVLQVYHHPGEARTFYAPDVEPSIDLPVPILGISGLNNYALPQPRHRAAAVGNTTNAAPRAGSGPGGTYMGTDFRAAYVPGSPFAGAGQSVGLLQFDGYTPSDIAYYTTVAGLPSVTLSNVLLDGFNGRPTGTGGEVEVSLDIEMAIAMAPGLSSVIVYMAGPSGNWHDLLNRMASDNLAKQLSCSWYIPGGGPDPVADQIFQQMAAQGQGFFNASGDADAFVGLIDFPGDTPYITQVGGTMLTTTGPAGAWVSERVWNRGNGVGSGGGISTTYGLPAYQTNIDMTANNGSTSKRNVPDVALTAENIYVRANGTDYSVGGTSASAPLWAGLSALINQAALANNSPVVGFVNPAVYALAKTPLFAANFHDITVGDNRSPSSPVNFVAVAGYDLCTGWGTPLGTNLIYSIGVPEPLRITPGGDLLFSGPAGGPFTPATQSYTLTNKATAGLDWNLSKDAFWISASPSGGTLAAGGPDANVVVRPSLAATNLAPGSYLATLTFSNLTDGFVQTRRVQLAIVTTPAIISQPASLAVFQGMNATFTVGTTSNALQYLQWQFDNGSGQTNLADGGSISGSAGPSLTISNVSPANVGAYSVVITNAAGAATSSLAFLTIVPWRPVITTQPADQTVLPGATTTFSVAAVGSQPFSYRWTRNGTNLAEGGNFLGTATSTLTVSNVTPAILGSYAVVVSNALGAALSGGAALSLVPVTAPGVALDALHSFAGVAYGYTPYAGLVQTPDGNFYGTALDGGANGFGTVYRFSTNGAVSLVHAFTDGTEGAIPYSPLIVGTNGSLYGVTISGGAPGYGTAFRMTTNGANITLAAFNYSGSGGYPVGGLFQAGDGNYYGTTLYGGLSDYGTLFRITAAGSFATLRSFSGVDGAYSSSMLMQAADGRLYGTAESGGTNGGWGTVFRAGFDGTTKAVASFNYTNGSSPVAGVVQDVDGAFYGTAYYGGADGAGTVFKLTPDGVLTAIHSFTGGSDGGNPFGGLLLASDGNLYGTTEVGGNYGVGTLFRISTTGAFSTLAHFDGYQGAYPECTLAQGSDGNLYGTASGGGQNNEGTIYRLTIDAPLLITRQPQTQQAFLGAAALFSVATFGQLPVAYQWRKNGQPLNDDSRISGAHSRVLSLTNLDLPDAALYSVVVSNSHGSVTSAPAALQIIVSPPFIVSEPEDQTVLAGSAATLSVWVDGDEPLSYQWQKDGTNVVDSANVVGSTSDTLTILSAASTNSGVYTVTVSNALLSVASDPATLTVLPPVQPGGSLSALHQFGGGFSGANPYAPLIQAQDGLFYGTTVNGGFAGYGTAYRVGTAGSFNVLHSFQNGGDAALPLAGLLQGRDGNFYGAAFAGGAGSAGALYQMNSSGQINPLYTFQGLEDGGSPPASLIQGADAKLYGVSYRDGTNGLGGVYSVTTNGEFVSLAAFDSINGAGPVASLVQGTNGFFYGTTYTGGANNLGTVYFVTTNGALAALVSFNGTNGANPAGALIQAADGAFYGTTEAGGTNGGWGTVFRVTGGGALTTLHAFNGNDGAYPEAGLFVGTDGNLYGTTSEGGWGGQGTLFRITPAGELTTLIWFSGPNGANPFASVTQARDGSFWGTTAFGAVGYNGLAGTGNGLAFRLVLPMFLQSPFTQAVAQVSVPYAASLVSNTITAPGNSLTFSKLGGPVWLNVAANGALTGTPALDDLGTNSFIVQLADVQGWTASATMRVPVASSPWITASLMPQGGSLWLSWSGRAAPYQVQTAANPVTPVWTAITGWLNTNRLAISATNTAAYYRVVGQ
jgi:uncharacterized repeat protein (TIGR03803 family)